MTSFDYKVLIFWIILYCVSCTSIPTSKFVSIPLLVCGSPEELFGKDNVDFGGWVGSAEQQYSCVRASHPTVRLRKADFSKLVDSKSLRWKAEYGLSALWRISADNVPSCRFTAGDVTMSADMTCAALDKELSQ